MFTLALLCSCDDIIRDPRKVAYGRCIQHHRPNLKTIRENGEECLKMLGQETMVNILLYIGNMETIPTDFLANAEHNCGGWWPVVQWCTPQQAAVTTRAGEDK